MLLGRDSLQIERLEQSESQGMKKDIPCIQKQKESWSSNIVSVRINFKTKSKKQNKKQRRTLHNFNLIQEKDTTPKYISNY